MHPAPDIGVNKNHILHKKKTNREINEKGKYQRGNMWLESIKTQVEHFFPENKLIAKSVQEKPQHCVGTATGCIPEGLQWKPFSKRLVKKIDYSGNLVMNHKYYLDWREDNYCAALFFINR